MTTLVITRGLPASGKTTYARSWVSESPTNRVRVNRDDLRMMLFGRTAPLLRGHELTVTTAQRAQVAALLAERSVIVDDTHLRLRHARAWADLAASLGCAFEVVDIATPLDECLRRDAGRERQVGEDAICGLAARYPFPLPTVTPTDRDDTPTQPYTPDPALPSAWLVDVDGTLAEMGDRSPYDLTRVHEDTPHRHIVDLVRALAWHGHDIVIMSGRETSARQATETWLAANDVTYDALLMRTTGDTRSDEVVKAELFDTHIRTHYRVAGVLDDRNRVVTMWRSLGLTCLQVAEGDF